MRNMYYVDMHCHAAPKPYSWSFKKKNKSWDCRNVRKSLWYNDPPRVLDKFVNRRFGLTRFTQSDFRTLTKGGVRIISACLSPIERGLVTARCCRTVLCYTPGKIIVCILLKLLGSLIIKAVGLFSMRFIIKIRKKNRDYFDELRREYIYYYCEERKQRDANFPTIFKLTSSFDDIDPKFRDSDHDIMYVFFSIEGSHVFHKGGLKSRLKYDKITDKIKAVKNWTHQPLYISMAHHMYNDLCGHAKSLTPPLERMVDQETGMDTGFTETGKIVLRELLKKDNGSRIYIDIKHMSVKSRYQYYYILETEYGEGIPVFASHGAVSGRDSLEKWVEDNFDKWVRQECPKGDIKNLSNGIRKKNKKNSNIENSDKYQNENHLQFNNGDINFFDDEILRIERTGGFLGIQIDERRLCSPEEKKDNKKKRKRGEQLYHQAGLVWKQIRYIAEVLDNKGRPGWFTAAIGSDYDGLVDPPNGYWSSDDFGILEENLIHHAFKYFMYYSGALTQKQNIDPYKYPVPNQAGAQAQDSALVKALAKTNIRAQAKALSAAVAAINKQIKVQDNTQPQDNALTGDETRGEVQEEAPDRAEDKDTVKILAICLVQLLGFDLVLRLIRALINAPTKPKVEKLPNAVQDKKQAMDNAMLVIDLFMRGNAIRFLNHFYK